MKMKRKNFTLIELLVALTIIGILSVMLTIIGFGIYFGYKAYSSVKEEGIKGTMENVYYGEKGIEEVEKVKE